AGSRTPRHLRTFGISERSNLNPLLGRSWASSRRHRLAPNLVRGFAWPSPRSSDVDLHDVTREEPVQRPVDRHPDLALQAGQAHQVVAAPQEPADETGHAQSEHLADPIEPPQRYEHAKLRVGERGLRP